MPFLPPNQQHQSTEGTIKYLNLSEIYKHWIVIPCNFLHFKNVLVTCIVTIIWPIVRHYLMSWYQIKQSPINTYPDHQPSFISFLYLLQSIASALFNLHAWQSFCTTSLQVRFGQPRGLAPSLHTPYISSPNNCLLFTTHMPNNSLSLNSLLGTLSFTLTSQNPSDHSHLCPPH